MVKNSHFLIFVGLVTLLNSACRSNQAVIDLAVQQTVEAQKIATEEAEQTKSETTVVVVDATMGWQSTDVIVNSGETIRLGVVQGAWTYWPDELPPNSGVGNPSYIWTSGGI